MFNFADSPLRTKEKWVADFSKNMCFEIRPEISRDVYIEKNKKKSLFIGLKKKNALTSIEMPESSAVYTNQYIEANFSLEGTNCAAGVMFCNNGSGSYYLALVSDTGHFRLALVTNHVSRTLAGWIKIPSGILPNERTDIRLGIIVFSGHMIFTVCGKWAAEVYDNSVPGGRLGLALVSFDNPEHNSSGVVSSSVLKDSFSCQARIYSLSLDTDFYTVFSGHKKWTDIDADIGMTNRRLLAESFFDLDRPDAAYDQILKTWKQREDAAKKIAATHIEMRTKEELLLAARFNFRLGKFQTAEEYVNLCLEMCSMCKNSGENNKTIEWEALAEKAKILCSGKKFDALAGFLPAYIEKAKSSKDQKAILPSLYVLTEYALRSL